MSLLVFINVKTIIYAVNEQKIGHIYDKPIAENKDGTEELNNKEYDVSNSEMHRAEIDDGQQEGSGTSTKENVSQENDVTENKKIPAEDLENENSEKQNKVGIFTVQQPRKEMKCGEQQILGIGYQEAAECKLTFDSSNKDVAVIDAEGKISALNEGETVIKISSQNHEESFGLTVIADKIKVTEIELGDYQEIMKPGQRQTLTVMVFPLSASDKSLIYSSSDEKIAKINELGVISALAEGDTIIKVVCGDVVAAFKLYVTKEGAGYIPVENIELSEYEEKLEVDKIMQLYATVLPSDATKAKVNFSTQTPDIVSVSSKGIVKGLKKGEAIITLKADDFSKEIKIQVFVKTKEIEVDNKYIVLKANQDERIIAKATPKEADQKLCYKSKNQDVAKVDQDGTVHAVGVGSTAIIISNEDMTASVSVIVNASDEEKVSHKLIKEEKNEISKFNNTVNANDEKEIKSEALLYLYQNKEQLLVYGDGYHYIINGENIRNYKNVMETDIHLENKMDGVHFCLNSGRFLCGNITLSIDDVEGKHLYLYNDSKRVYEEISVDSFNMIVLTSPGKYLITNKRIVYSMARIRIIFICGGIICFFLLIIYIFTKKKYWFW